VPAPVVGTGGNLPDEGEIATPCTTRRARNDNFGARDGCASSLGLLRHNNIFHRAGRARPVETNAEMDGRSGVMF